MTKENEFTAVNTCVAADFRVRVDEIARAKELLIGLGSNYTIEPHLTLLLMPCTPEGFERLKPLLAQYFDGLNKFSWTIEGVEYEERSRFLKLKIEAPRVFEMHRELLAIATTVRTNELREKDIKKISDSKYSQEEKERLQRYGFVYAGEGFDTHITIGNIPAELDVAEVRKQIEEILKPLYGKECTTEEITWMFHTDSTLQSEMRELWRTTAKLKN